MHYINIEQTTLAREEFQGADPIDQATWLNLMAYCARMENGGLIRACAEWTDRMWRTCGVSKKQVDRECKLWRRVGNGIRVYAYPVEQEQKTKLNRNRASKGGKTSAAKRSSSTPEVANAQADAQPTASTKEKEEGKEKEKSKEELEQKDGIVSESESEIAVESPTPGADYIESVRSIWSSKGFSKEEILRAYAEACQKNNWEQSPAHFKWFVETQRPNKKANGTRTTADRDFEKTGFRSNIPTKILGGRTSKSPLRPEDMPKIYYPCQDPFDASDVEEGCEKLFEYIATHPEAERHDIEAQFSNPAFSTKVLNKLIADGEVWVLNDGKKFGANKEQREHNRQSKAKPEPPKTFKQIEEERQEKLHKTASKFGI